MAVLLQGNDIYINNIKKFFETLFQVFDLLTVAALIDGQVLCVHGGLSPDIRTLDQVNV